MVHGVVIIQLAVQTITSLEFSCAYRYQAPSAKSRYNATTLDHTGFVSDAFSLNPFCNWDPQSTLHGFQLRTSHT